MSAQASSGTILRHTTAHLAASWPVRVAIVALAVALQAAAAQFTSPVPGTDVPFALTPMVVLLTGAALGSRLGWITQLTYLAAGALGLAVFVPSATLPPGALRLFGPTGGYLMAYPIAAFVTGRLAERGWDRRYFTSLCAMLAGLLIIHAGGLAWKAVLAGSMTVALATTVMPFALPDLLKAGLAAGVLPQVWRMVPRRPGV